MFTCGENSDCTVDYDITRTHGCIENAIRLHNMQNPNPRPLGCKCDVKPCLHRPRTGQEATRIIAVAGRLIGQ